MLQYKLQEQIEILCFKRKYNLNRYLLSNKLSHKLEAESSFIREKTTRIGSQNKGKSMVSYFDHIVQLCFIILLILFKSKNLA